MSYFKLLSVASIVLWTIGEASIWAGVLFALADVLLTPLFAYWEVISKKFAIDEFNKRNK